MRWLIRLRHAFSDGNRTESSAHITDIGAGVLFLCSKFCQFLRRGHVGVAVLQAIFAVEVTPGIFPVGPAIWHADAVDLTFGARGFF